MATVVRGSNGLMMVTLELEREHIPPKREFAGKSSSSKLPFLGMGCVIVPKLTWPMANLLNFWGLHM